MAKVQVYRMRKGKAFLHRYTEMHNLMEASA